MDVCAETSVTISGTQAHHDDYRVALYYVYIVLRDLEEVINFHHSFSSERSVGGRIRVCSEGINGVLSGKLHDLELYERELRRLLYRTTCSDRSLDESLPWELDVKYCHLRTDLSVESQLFADWKVQETDSVVGLMEVSSRCFPDSVHDADSVESKSSDNSPTSLWQKRRRRLHQGRKKNESYQLQQYHLDAARDIFQESILKKVLLKQPLFGAPHLSPVEWNAKLEALVQQQGDSAHNVVLLDCRNCYESAVGYFQVPNATTVLTNTRKYSELPIVLMDQLSNQNAALRTASHIFMYCTGGVRCERASVFLQAATSHTFSLNVERIDEENTPFIPQIYQLHGGIQRYLEYSSNNKHRSSFYKGKNFVFDLRRTDPTVTQCSNDVAAVVGKCLVCDASHDDYDNGHAPSTNNESRCFKCRMLVLVCDKCRPAVLCWGDAIVPNEKSSGITEQKPKLFCGGLAPKECVYMPPALELRE